MANSGRIPPAALQYLRELAANNNKPWFEANRARYESALKQPIAALVGAVTAELARRSIPLEGDAKRSTFRIHRDVRFSKDKSPYKTAAGVVWYRQGSGKDGAGVLYLHLAPEGCFTAAGFWQPDAETLGAVRERMRVHPQRFVEVRAQLAETGLVLSEQGALSRMPRGFEDLKESPVGSALRLRSLIVSRTLPEKEVFGARLAGLVAQMGADALPLLRFGWDAIDEVRAA